MNYFQRILNDLPNKQITAFAIVITISLYSSAVSSQDRVTNSIITDEMISIGPDASLINQDTQIIKHPMLFHVLLPECDKKFSMDVCKNILKQTFKESPLIISKILPYFALKNDDPAVCNSISDEFKPYCHTEFDSLRAKKKNGENKCNELTGDYYQFCRLSNSKCTSAEISQLCLEFNQTCDAGRINSIKSLCMGWTQGSVALLKKYKEQSCLGGDDCIWDEADSLESMAVFQSYKYKYGSKEICQKFIMNLEGHYIYLCDILFGDKTLDVLLDEISEDLAYFRLSEEYKSKALCRKINNPKIQEYCFSADREKYFEANF